MVRAGGNQDSQLSPGPKEQALRREASAVLKHTRGSSRGIEGSMMLGFLLGNLSTGSTAQGTWGLTV